MNNIPDVIGKNLNEGRKILFSNIKNCSISIYEVHSYKEKEICDISEGTIINQKYINDNIILYVAFFDPPIKGYGD